jgi:hypothetical protein
MARMLFSVTGTQKSFSQVHNTISILHRLLKKIRFHFLFPVSFGAAFTVFYRLVGPYTFPAAPAIVRTELWESVTRRGWAGNLFMGVIPMAFYAVLNLAAFLLELVWIACGRPWKERTGPGSLDVLEMQRDKSDQKTM